MDIALPATKAMRAEMQVIESRKSFRSKPTLCRGSGTPLGLIQVVDNRPDSEKRHFYECSSTRARPFGRTTYGFQRPLPLLNWELASSSL